MKAERGDAEAFTTVTTVIEEDAAAVEGVATVTAEHTAVVEVGVATVTEKQVAAVDSDSRPPTNAGSTSRAISDCRPHSKADSTSRQRATMTAARRAMVLITMINIVRAAHDAASHATQPHAIVLIDLADRP